MNDPGYVPRQTVAKKRAGAFGPGDLVEGRGELDAAPRQRGEIGQPLHDHVRPARQVAAARCLCYQSAP
jgi:hypothetical protein